MRIGIALNLLAPDNGGVTNYVLTLLRHWPEYAPDHKMVLFSFAHNEPLLATLPPEVITALWAIFRGENGSPLPEKD